MAAPVVTLHELIEAGAHFGHQTHRWNPRMKPYIFGARNGIHVIDLSQTVPLMARALDFVASTIQAGGKVLFVGTKRQAQQPIAEGARACGQHFVNQCDLRKPCDQRIEVHLLQRLVLVGEPLAWQHFETHQQRLGLRPSMGLDHTDNHVEAGLQARMRALQHFVGLADAGSGADKDLQSAGLVVLPPGSFQKRIRRGTFLKVAICHKAL